MTEDEMEIQDSDRVLVNVREAEVPIHAVTMENAVSWILGGGRREWEVVVTPNLHHLRLAGEKPYLSKYYADAALSLPDGWPVAWLASRRAGFPIERVAGADLFRTLVARDGGGRILVLVGGAAGKELDSLCVRCRSNNWRVVCEPAPPLELADRNKRELLLRRVAEEGCGGIVVVGVGSPKQEELAYELARMPGRGTVLCLGMSINFASGAVPRAPKLVSRVGLEWVFRALSEPRRLFGRYLADLGALYPLTRANPRVSRSERWR